MSLDLKNNRFLLAWAIVATMGCAGLFIWSLREKAPQSIPGAESPAAIHIARPLVIWVYGAEAQNINLILSDFRKSFPNEDVRIVGKSWGEYPGPLLASLPSKEQPDLIQIGSTWVAPLVESGLLLALDDNIRTSIVRGDRMISEAWELYRADSAQVAIPWYLDLRALYYRSDLVPDPPKSWDDLRGIARRLRVDVNGDGRKDRYGLSCGFGDVNNFLSVFWSSNGSLDRLDGKELETAFDRFVGIFKDEIAAFGPYEETRDPEAILALGYTPMMISGPWNIRLMQADYPWLSDSWSTAALPRYERRVSFVGGSGWAIPKGARNPEGAWNFIEYMSNVNRQTEWFQISGDLPANKEAWEKEVMTAPVLAGFREALTEINYPPVDSRWSETERKWGAILKDAIDGRMNRSQALAGFRAAAEWIQTR